MDYDITVAILIVGNCNVEQAKQQGMNLQEYRRDILESTLTRALVVITPDLCKSFYNHSDKYLLKCIHNEEMCIESR